MIGHAARRLGARVIPRVLLGVALGWAGCAGAAELVLDGLQFPQAPLFIGPVLYFTDFGSSDVLRLVGGKAERVWHQDGCGPTGLAQIGKSLLVACFNSGALVQLSPEGKVAVTLTQDAAGQKFLAPNDLVADGNGGAYLSTAGSENALGRLFYRRPDGSVVQVAGDVAFAAGVALSPDGRTLYAAESRVGRVLRFTVAPDGTLSDRAVFVQLRAILTGGKQAIFNPGGLRADANGNLFVALYNGGGLAVVNAQAALLQQTEAPAEHHANLAIAPDGKTVIVAAVDDAADGRYRGALYRLPNPLGAQP